MWACQQQKAPREFSISRAIVDVCSSASFRALRAASNIQYALFSALFVLPKASADYPNLSNNTSSNYNDFTPSQSNDSRVLADISNFKATSIGFPEWQAWAHTIRASGGVAQCVGNLSIALSEVGSAYAASSNGASTLLTLIPTAGALIGAPARELWVLYKLMPIAGILSMMLSLGGNIVPMDISDYEQVDTFSYAGMIPTADQKTNSFVAKSTGETEAERFAALVHSRARDKLGARRSVAIWFGILLQCFWLTCILIACWFLDSGSIIVWWCTNNGWMFFWFGIVAMSSLMENLAGVPFSRQWTIRVSRAPRIEIDEGAPWAIEPPQENYAPPTVSSPLVGKPLNYSGDEDIGVTTTERITTFATSSRTSSYNIERKPLPSH